MKKQNGCHAIACTFLALFKLTVCNVSMYPNTEATRRTWAARAHRDGATEVLPAPRSFSFKGPPSRSFESQTSACRCVSTLQSPCRCPSTVTVRMFRLSWSAFDISYFVANHTDHCLRHLLLLRHRHDPHVLSRFPSRRAVLECFYDP
jgi:hypothetical protein